MYYDNIQIIKNNNFIHLNKLFLKNTSQKQDLIRLQSYFFGY